MEARRRRVGNVEKDHRVTLRELRSQGRSRERLAERHCAIVAGEAIWQPHTNAATHPHTHRQTDTLRHSHTL